jgi:Pro-kumamolisin, activation domain/PKD domain
MFPWSFRPADRPRAALGAIAAVAILLLSGSAFLEGRSPVPAALGQDAGSGTRLGGEGVVVAPAFVPGPQVQLEGALPARAPMTVEVALGAPDLGALEAAALAANTPGDPAFHQFLSPAEATARLAAPPSTVAAAVAYFGGFGLRSTPSPDRYLLEVSGPAEQMGLAFHTQFERYASGGREFFSHPSPATLPAGLPWYGAVGLGDRSSMRPASLLPSWGADVRPAASSCTVSGPLPPCALWTAYDAAGLIGAGTNGSGRTIGIVDAYDSAEPQSQLQSDFNHFAAAFNLSNGRVRFAYPVPAGNTLNTSASNQWGDEEALDLEWTRASAPGDSIVMALAANTNPALYGAVDWMVAVHAADVLSLSWGEPDTGIYNAVNGPCPNQCNASSDGSYGLLHPVLVAAAAEGIGVFVASGDCGSADGTSGVATNYPASDPWTVGVGGTSLSVDSSTGAYVSETAWSGNATGATSPGCNNQGGSGGGYAPFARPVWQVGPGLPANGARGVPDVSVDAATGVPIVWEGFTASVVGTSVSTPIWAGVEVIAEQALARPLGDLAPVLYAILANGSYGAAFHDIVSGSNGYAAHTGWDPVTGLGSPDVARLLRVLSPPPPGVPDLVVRLGASGTAGGLPLTVAFTANASGGSGSYPSYDFVFGDGNASFQSTATSQHVYVAAGVYNATVTVFDSVGNSSTAFPVAVVAGGGSVLAVRASANATGGAPGTSIGFRVATTGAQGPVRYELWFGDGTYSVPGAASAINHTYRFAGGFCAVALAIDAASPPDGGSSLPISLAVGGAARPVCATGPPIFANLTSAVVAADLPGDLPIRWNASGGSGPLTGWFDSIDRYSTLCQCGIFRTAGTFPVDLYVNDSTGDRIVRSLNVTLYPALVGTFASSPPAGGAPLAMTFRSSVTGGTGADANLTRWTFGDGAVGVGALVNHTYAVAGEYVAVGQLRDLGRGNASEAFVIDAEGSAALGVTATIAPAISTATGAPVRFRAAAVGGSGPYTFLWNLSDGSSAYGADVTESPRGMPCAGNASCPLALDLTVTDGAGAARAVRAVLDPFWSERGSALNVTAAAGPRSGTTPLRWTSSSGATGMPGVAIAWTFGDGGSSAGGSARHLYLRPGNFTVVANLTDAGPERWSWTQAVEVNGSVIEPLVAAIVPANTSCIGPCVANLTVGVAGGGGGPYNYSWQFGDGAGGSGATVLHAFAAYGRFNVSVTVTDGIGDTATAAGRVTHYAPTPVLLRIDVGTSTVTAGGSFSVTVLAAVPCGPTNVPGCPAPIPITLAVRTGNASGVALASYALGPIAPGGASTVVVVAPPLVGPFWLAATADPPNFTGSAVTAMEVVVAPAGASDAAALALLAVGAAVGVASAIAVLLLGPDRRATRPPFP